MRGSGGAVLVRCGGEVAPGGVPRRRGPGRATGRGWGARRGRLRERGDGDVEAAMGRWDLGGCPDPDRGRARGRSGCEWGIRGEVGVRVSV